MVTSPFLRAAALMMPLACLAQAPASDMKMVDADKVQWMDAPPSLPKGAKLAVLAGDPSKPGPFVLRLKTPGKYIVAPHWHSQAENLTIISGTLYLGMGDKLDRKGAHALKAGGFHALPGKAHHFAYSTSPTVVEVHGEGPFDIHYINAADNPDKSASQP